MKNFVKCLGTVVSTMSVLSLMTATSVSATTKDDVIAVAREVGMPESLVQSYISLGANVEVTSEQCDKAITKLYQIYGTTNDKINDDFNVDISDEPSVTTTTTQSTTNQSADISTQDDQSTSTTIDVSQPDQVVDTTNQTTQTDDTTQPNTIDSLQEDTITTDNTSIDTASSGEEYQSPIDEDTFISMSYDEKIEFVQSLPEEEQNTFMNNLTTAERNSIIKQMDIDSKTDIINAIVDAGKSMGYNFSIDELSDSNISLSMRDEEGTLIGVTNFGTSVDDTGKDYTGLILSMVAIIGLSGYGLFKISKKVSKV